VITTIGDFLCIIIMEVITDNFLNYFQHCHCVVSIVLLLSCCISGVVTVEFSSEKDQATALRRNKNYVGKCAVFVPQTNSDLLISQSYCSNGLQCFDTVE